MTHATLLVGGEPHPAADWAADIPAGGPTYREVALEVPLSRFGDPWVSLRALRDLLADGGVLSFAPGALRAASLPAFLRLAGLEPIVLGERVRARAVPRTRRELTVSVIVPCRDEVENVPAVVRRLPTLGAGTELIFVDGNSTDGTVQRIEQLIRAHPDRSITLLRQRAGGGKAAAVFQGFDAAAGDVVLILDADLAVAPEDLPRFVLALTEGAAEFANGARFAYPREEGAMPALNAAGNRAFAALLSRLLASQITDTLCGTKALFRRDWASIREVRLRFGQRDPWGDFDLLFGAAACGLSILDVPVPYHARTSGESKMQPWRHGLALAETTLTAALALHRST